MFSTREIVIMVVGGTLFLALLTGIIVYSTSKTNHHRAECAARDRGSFTIKGTTLCYDRTTGQVFVP